MVTPPGRAAGRIEPFLAGAVLALPVGLAAAWLISRRPPFTLWESMTLRGYVLSLGAALLIAALGSFARRRNRAGGRAVGALLLVGGAAAAAELRFVGDLSLGDGEGTSEYARVSKGPGGAPPPGGVTYAMAESGGRHALTFGGRTSAVSPGGWTFRPGTAAHLAEVHVAPAFTIYREDGTVEDQLLVKLSPSDLPRRWFQMSVLPYRFFATVERPIGIGPPSAPARIAIRVMRGKLTVARGTIGPGEALSFEGFRLTWREGASWVHLQVWRFPWWLFPTLATGLALLGACARRERGRDAIAGGAHEEPAEAPGTADA